MAGILRCRLARRYSPRIFRMCLSMAALTCKRLWAYLVAHHYGIGIASSLVLVFLNIAMFSYSCQGLSTFFGPFKLQHGFVPVFPDHLFHGPDLNSNESSLMKPKDLKKPEDMDMYLRGHIMLNSLSVDIPPVAHVVWCDSGPFTFTHYLSVLAVFKLTSPSILTLHLITKPELDADGYFQFLPDLQRDLPPLVTTTLKDSMACSADAQDRTIAFMKILGSTGGIIVSGRAILSPSPSLTSLVRNKVTIATEGDKESVPLMVAAHTDVIKDVPTRDRLTTFHISHSTRYLKCEHFSSFSFPHKTACVNVPDNIFPVMIFNGTSHFNSLARWIGYGSCKELIPQPANSEIVPNIVHYVWLGKRELNYFGYLSVLSSIYVLKAEVVYIHGDYKPLGGYWAKIERNPHIKFIHRDFPKSVYGEPIEKFASHASDYLRGDVLLRYGGVYADWDVIFLKKLPQSVRQHNTTVNVDFPETGAFPDVFNLGVLVSAPGAPFLRHFLESYRWYLDRHWSYNAIHMPYKVYEKVPASLNVNRHLQILCALGSCHATWLKDYKVESTDHLSSGNVDWKKDAISIHWTHPDPDEFANEETLLASDSVIGEIGKTVLKKAGLLQ